MKKRLTIAAILILLALAGYCKDKKPLRNTRYSASQLRSCGYNVHFKGKIFVTYKRYIEINKL